MNLKLPLVPDEPLVPLEPDLFRLNLMNLLVPLTNLKFLMFHLNLKLPLVPDEPLEPEVPLEPLKFHLNLMFLMNLMLPDATT
jgi:hypothetical protein